MRGYELRLSDVAAVAQEATGSLMASAVRLRGGNDRAVYDVETSTGLHIVVRAGVGGGLTASQEAWALEQSRAAGVPVPEVLLVTSVETEDCNVPVMVQSRATGEQFSALLPRLSKSHVRAVTVELGAILARLHSIPVEGFYRRHADGRWDFPDLEALLVAALASRRAEADLLAAAGLTRPEIHTAMGRLAEGLAAAGTAGPVLCHGDPGPDHLFVDDQLRVTALIDFGLASGGRPFDDIVVLHRNWPAVEIDALQIGYGPATFWADQRRRLAAGKVPLLIGYIAYCVRVGRYDDAHRNADQLRDVLAAMA